MLVASLYTVHTLPVGTLSILARPRGRDWLAEEITALRVAGVDVLVSLLTPAEVEHFELAEEAAYSLQQGIHFESFPIQDRQVPARSATTFRFLERLYAALADGKHVAIHCRQGLGRAPLMAACLLVHSGLTHEDAWKVLSQARGTLVPETDAQRAWVQDYAQRYRRFLQQGNWEVGW